MSVDTNHLASWPAPSLRTLDQPLRQPPAIDRVVAKAPSSSSATRVPRLSSTNLILLPLRVFLAAGWLRAGIEKLINPNWWNGDQLHAFIDTNRDHALGWFVPVLDHAVTPAATLVAFVVMSTEIACGLALAFGRYMREALWWGVLLNVTFILAGRVNPSAFYLVMEIALLVAIAECASLRRPAGGQQLFAFAALATAAGVICIPSIATIEPAKVIDDPAMMLTFLSFTTAGILVFRALAARAEQVKPDVLARFLAGASVWARTVPDDSAGIPDRPRVDR
jgi:uncharacterized membrane protein YphA (DoxX/SURF4 family)